MKGVFVMAIDIYARRKAQGLCIRCGRRLSTDEKQYAQCPTCRVLMAERIKNYRTSNRGTNTITHSKKYISPAMSLSDVVKMATANGLSYGNMVAVLEGRTAFRQVFHYSGVTKITPSHGE